MKRALIACILSVGFVLSPLFAAAGEWTEPDWQKSSQVLGKLFFKMATENRSPEDRFEIKAGELEHSEEALLYYAAQYKVVELRVNRGIDAESRGREVRIDCILYFSDGTVVYRAVYANAYGEINGFLTLAFDLTYDQVRAKTGADLSNDEFELLQEGYKRAWNLLYSLLEDN